MTASRRRIYVNCVSKKSANYTDALKLSFSFSGKGGLNRAKGGDMTSDVKQKAQETSPKTILLITLAMFAAGIFFILWGAYEIMA